MAQIYNFQPSQPVVRKPTSNFPWIKREEEVQLVNFVKSKQPDLKGWELFAEVKKAYTDIYNNKGVPLGKVNQPNTQIENTPPPNQWGLRRGSSRFKIGGKVDNFFDNLNVVGKGFEKLDDVTQKIPTVSEEQVEGFLDKNVGWEFGKNMSKIPTMAINAPWSLAKTATATARWITNPFDTIVGLGKLLWTKEGREAITQRYGTIKGFNEAMTEDPLWVASDALTVIQWGASVVSKWASMVGFTNVADVAWDIARTAWGAADLWLSTAIPKGLDMVVDNAPWGDIGKNIAKWLVSGTNPLKEAQELYNKIPNPTDAVARQLTNTSSAQDKLFKAQNPSINKLGRNVDLWAKRANSDLANKLIADGWYKPVDTSTRLDAHDATMKSKRANIESSLQEKNSWFDRVQYMIDQKQIADVIDEFVKEAEKSSIEANKPDLNRLKKESKAMRDQWLVDIPTLEKKKQFINNVINNRWNSEIWDVYKNWMKKATKKIGQLEDVALSKIPWEFTQMKREFWALKDTYADVLKAHIKNEKAKWIGIIESYSKLEWLTDILWWTLSVFTRGGEAFKDIAKWAGKVFLWKALKTARDVDFLIEEWFSNLQ